MGLYSTTGKVTPRVPTRAPSVARVSSPHPPSSGQSCSWPAPNRGVHVQRHKENWCVSLLAPVSSVFPFSRARSQATRKRLNGSRGTCRETPCFAHSIVRSRINPNLIQKTKILNATITFRCCKRRSHTFQNLRPLGPDATLGPVFHWCRREKRPAAARARHGCAFKARLEQGW